MTIGQADGIPASLAGSYETSTSYYANGLPKSTTRPAAGGLVAEQLTFGYDAIDRPTTLAGSLGSYVDETVWNPQGEVSRLALGNTYGALVWESFRYELGSRRLLDSRLDLQEVNDYTERTYYTYDPVGNVTSATTRGPDTLLGDVPDYPIVDRQCFSYDGLQQLTGAWTTSDACGSSAPAAPESASATDVAPYVLAWSNDVATGNRVSQTATSLDAAGAPVTKTTTYGYGQAGHPHAISGTDTLDSATQVTSSDSYGYDAVGNQTSRTVGGVARTLEWDVEGHLAAISEGSTVVQSAAYDPAGSRFFRQAGTVSTVWLPDGTQISDTAGTLSAERPYSFAGMIVAVRTGNSHGDVATLMSDPHGTAHYAVSNAAAAPGTARSVDVRRETPYGGIRQQQAPNGWPSSRGFVGGENDTATGLVHIGARPYDPALGVFIADDPITDRASTRQINGYAYSNANPATLSDPSGMQYEENYSRDPVTDPQGPSLDDFLSGTLEVLKERVDHVLKTDPELLGKAKASNPDVRKSARNDLGVPSNSAGQQARKSMETWLERLETARKGLGWAGPALDGLNLWGGYADRRDNGQSKTSAAIESSASTGAGLGTMAIGASLCTEGIPCAVGVFFLGVGASEAVDHYFSWDGFKHGASDWLHDQAESFKYFTGPPIP